jgi:predicted Zn finger-like uncharacterized protein
MDYRITQCPRCGTSFRVTDAHLAVAAGAVRCGSCLHIFNAREHWVEEKSAEDEAQEQVLRDDEAQEQQMLVANDDIPADAEIDEIGFGGDSDDDLLIGDDPSDHEPSFFTSDDDRLLFFDSDAEQPRLSADESGLAPDFLDSSGWFPDPSTSFGEERKESDDSDDAWAEQLLVDDAHTASDGHRLDNDADPLLDEFDDILANTPVVTEYSDEEASAMSDQSLYGDWQLSDDDYGVRPAAADPELQLSAEFLSIGELSRSANRESTGIADGSNLSPEWQQILGDDTTQSNDATLRADERIGDDRIGHGAGLRGHHLLGSFEPEPLELHRFVREPRWPKLLWALGLVAGIALLIAQYIYFNFPTLAREQRPLMTRLCAVISCVLPPQHDSTLIRPSSLIVRSHPNRPGALAVDAILTNVASFRQPYPNLLLQFTDLAGEPVAGGILTPADYLGGELAGTAQMPVQQPVHVGLTIADPGKRAVSYKLFVLPPEQR